MSKLKNYIIGEASYFGNIGFAEMVKFYQIANDKEIEEIEKIIKNNDWDGFKKLIYNKLKIKLI